MTRLAPDDVQLLEALERIADADLSATAGQVAAELGLEPKSVAQRLNRLWTRALLRRLHGFGALLYTLTDHGRVALEMGRRTAALQAQKSDAFPDSPPASAES